MTKRIKPRRVARITRNMLHLLEENSGISQRHLSEALGIALGATNAYIQKCTTQGWIQKQNGNACHRYEVTNKGLQHKSKLTLRCLRNDLTHYKTMRAEVSKLLQNNKKFYIYGKGPLVDMIVSCTLEKDGNLNRIKGFVEDEPQDQTYMGKDIITLQNVDSEIPIFLACLQKPLDSYRQIMLDLASQNVLMPTQLKEIMHTRKNNV